MSTTLSLLINLDALVWVARIHQLIAPQPQISDPDQWFNQGWDEVDGGHSEIAVDIFYQLLCWAQHQQDWRRVTIAGNSIGFIVDRLALSCALPPAPSTATTAEPLPSDPADNHHDDIHLGLRCQGQRLSALGSIHRRAGKIALAIEHYEQALPCFRAAQDAIGVGLTLNNLGVTYAQLGECDRTQALCQAAVAILQNTGDDRAYANALHNLGVISYRQKQFEAAIAALSKASTLRERIGDAPGEVASLSYLGTVYRQQGQYLQALACYEAASELCDQHGHLLPALEAKAILRGHLATLAQQTNQPEAAINYAQDALFLFEALGNPKNTGRILSQLGQIHESLGQVSTALKYYQQTLTALEQPEDGRCNSTPWQHPITPPQFEIQFNPSDLYFQP
jgi:tetratricopeptide (TPR) repeat protein